jgi:hypothetical protein
MKRVLSVFLVMTLCVGLIATTAFADDVNTTVNVNVTYNNAPSPSGSPSGPGGGSSSSSSSSSSGYTERQKRNALRLLFLDIKKELERELENTDGAIIEFKDAELDRSMRRIAKVTAKSDKNDEITCYVVALPKGKIRLRDGGRFAKDSCVEVFFTWNYNRNLNVSDYSSSWLITDRGQTPGEAIVQFAEKLLAGEITRP